jgi:hypothetical protein
MKGRLGIMLCVYLALLFFLTLTVQAYTTEVHVVRYGEDGTTIEDEITVNYSYMEAGLGSSIPVYGDGVTHYYFQGPIFESEWDEVHPGEPWNMWNPTEDVNVETRDYGAVKGTNVRDLCDLVGGMDPGHKVRIKASDGFYKWFPYDDVYNYTSQPEQGPMVLCWYNGDAATGEPQGTGYPDTGYSTGMRLFFFANTSTNPWGYHCFGDWNMHEYMEEQYWHYYSGDILYPSSSGLSVKWVSDIEIYTGEVNPDLIVTAIDTPDGIYNGTPNIISATIENIGNMGTFRPFNVTINDGSGVVDGTVVDIGELGAGENITVKFLWTPAAPNNYTLNVSADSDGFVAEGNETNNHMTKGVTVIPIPQTDLVVSMVHNGTVFINEPNVIFALIKNNGADAHSFNVSLEVDGALKDKVFVPMLHLRETQLVPFNWTPTALVDKTVYVTVDCNNDVTESNETNNVMSQLVDVASLTTVTIGDGQSIQAAITAASNGTKILVVDTHNEQLVIPSAKAAIRLIANGSNAVIMNDNPGDIIKVEATDCWVQGFSIHSTWNKDGEDDDEDFANYPGAGINITSNSWNVVKDNYIYNSSSGVNLYSSCNLFMNNTIGDTKAGRDCRRLMIISGDTNRIVKNVFDGNTSRHSWVLGGVLNYEETKYRVTAAPANGNLLRDNTFNVRGYHSPYVVFSGDQNLVFNNDINDTGTEIVAPSKLNWYYVDKAAVEMPKYGNVVHGPYYGGNCWSGYTGTDNNTDLLGDEAYNSYDAQPLIRAKCGDVNCDGYVTSADVYPVFKRTVSTDWAADVNGDGYVTSADVYPVFKRILNCCEG